MLILLRMLMNGLVEVASLKSVFPDLETQYILYDALLLFMVYILVTRR